MPETNASRTKTVVATAGRTTGAQTAPAGNIYSPRNGAETWHRRWRCNNRPFPPRHDARSRQAGCPARPADALGALRLVAGDTRRSAGNGRQLRGLGRAATRPGQRLGAAAGNMLPGGEKGLSVTRCSEAKGTMATLFCRSPKINPTPFRCFNR